MKKYLLRSLPVALLGALMMTGTAQAVDPEDAIEYRQGVFKAFSWNFGPMAGMAQGEIPFNEEMFLQRADQLARLADMPWQGFTEDSDLGDTDAKMEVWEDADTFEQKIEEFKEEVAALEALIDEGAEEMQLRRQAGNIGQSCQACHDSFRD
ncbi:cytochrome c [Thioalkalivibrio sp. ALJ24]|uniref:c-type cytochrome n=1 Tax=Thioalkalivibrio sp. ALJ24 TaxID=545276 RepID=UPI0003809D78|nr:cytochrome c [Thioalkalivibrio sp. ALJ24]